MGAVFQRESTGRGQLVDISGQEANANHVRTTISSVFHTPDLLPGREKANFDFLVPASDGYVFLTPYNLVHWWERFQHVMGDPEWATSDAFLTAADRMLNCDAIEPLVHLWSVQHTRAELYQMALDVGFPCFPVYSPAEMIESVQFQHRGFLESVEDPEAGSFVRPGPAAMLSRTPYRQDGRAPRLGEHNAELLSQPATDPAPAPSADRRPAHRPGRGEPAAQRRPRHGLRVDPLRPALDGLAGRPRRRGHPHRVRTTPRSAAHDGHDPRHRRHPRYRALRPVQRAQLLEARRDAEHPDRPREGTREGAREPQRHRHDELRRRGGRSPRPRLRGPQGRQAGHHHDVGLAPRSDRPGSALDRLGSDDARVHHAAPNHRPTPVGRRARWAARTRTSWSACTWRSQ